MIDGPASARIWPWFVIYGVTGAVALGFELVFFRVIDSVMRSNSYSFPHVLATYLVFFGVGSALGAVIAKSGRRLGPVICSCNGTGQAPTSRLDSGCSAAS